MSKRAAAGHFNMSRDNVDKAVFIVEHPAWLAIMFSKRAGTLRTMVGWSMSWEEVDGSVLY